MKTHYLSLSAFACIECNGPVISGSISTRENEIERSTDIRQIGSICLACRKQYGLLPMSRAIRHIAPFEWNSPELGGKKDKVAKPTSVV